MIYLGKGVRSFRIFNIHSVGQRAEKLRAVKKNSAAVANIGKMCASACGLGSSLPRPGQNHSQSLMDGKFEAL